MRSKATSGREWVASLEAEEKEGAVKALFQVEVSKVNTRITKEGKLAIVKLSEGHSAEDLSNRLGIL